MNHTIADAASRGFVAERMMEAFLRVVPGVCVAYLQGQEARGKRAGSVTLLVGGGVQRRHGSSSGACLGLHREGVLGDEMRRRKEGVKGGGKREEVYGVSLDLRIIHFHCYLASGPTAFKIVIESLADWLRIPPPPSTVDGGEEPFCSNAARVATWSTIVYGPDLVHSGEGAAVSRRA